MFSPGNKIFFLKHVFKHVTTKVSCHHSSLLAKGSIRTCICGIKYRIPLTGKLSDGEINGNYVLAQHRTNTFLKYSTESIKHNNDLEKALGQTEDDFKNEVLKELERACNSDLSYLDCFELLEIASLVDVKSQDFEFLGCYYKLLGRVDKNYYFYHKYLQHYCQLKNELSGNVATLERRAQGSEELRKKFEFINNFKNRTLKRKPSVSRRNLKESNLSTERVTNNIEYLLSNQVSKEEIVEFLSKTFRIPFTFKNIDSKFIDDCYKVLQKLNDLSHSDFIRFRRKFFDILNHAATKRDLNPSHYIRFLSTYKDYVKSQKDTLEAGLLHVILERIKHNEGFPELTNEDRFSVLTAMADLKFWKYDYVGYLKYLLMTNSKNRTECGSDSATNFDDEFRFLGILATMRHADIEYVEFMRNLVIKKPELLEESIENLYAFLETLALTDFQNQRKNFWPHLRNLIADLNIFQNVNKWEQTDLFYHLHIVKLLLLWGICPKPLLTSLSERCNGEILTDDFEQIFKVMLSVNQAVYSFLPSFNKPFLNPNTLITIKNKLFSHSKFVETGRYNTALKRSLTSEVNKENTVLANCFTKQGLRIDLVVALNEANEVYNFSNNMELTDGMYIEDIPLPENYQLIPILILRRGPETNDVAFNYPNELFDSKTQLNMKSLQAVGFMPIPIVRRSWNNNNTPGRESKIWKIIRDKNNTSVPVSEFENTKEPASFV